MSIKEAFALEPTVEQVESREKTERLFLEEEEKDPLFLCKFAAVACALPAYIALDSIAMRLIGA